MSAYGPGAEQTFLYFGYGSNLLRERIHLQNPSAVRIDVANLQDFKLCFGKQKDWFSRRWQGGVATVEQSVRDSVWGVVWRLSIADLANLDKQEDEGTIYKRNRVTVKSMEGTSYLCWTYMMIGLLECRPSPQYLDVIRKGAEQNGLPADYCNLLNLIDDNQYSGDVKIMDAIDAKMDNNEDSFLYFAYGSNLLKERLRMNNPSAEIVGPAKLQGYKLCFISSPNVNLHSTYWRGAPASIRHDSSSYLWGIVWKLHRSDLQSLDRQESMYQAMNVTVEMEEGRVLECRTYHQSANFIEQLPSPHYMKVIIEGAKQNGIPRDYVEYLKSLAHNGDTNPPAVMTRLF